MKHFFSFIAAVLFLSVVLVVPADKAELKTYFLWTVYAVCILWLVNEIKNRLERDRKS